VMIISLQEDAAHGSFVCCLAATTVIHPGYE
jgi:hypothetical protein